MNEAKILDIDPSCWSWVNIWRLSWAGRQLKASQDMRSTTKVGTAHQVATGNTGTAVTPQHLWCPRVRGREHGVRLLVKFLSMCWSTLSSSSVCLSPPLGLRWKSMGVISGIKTRLEFAHWETGPSSGFQGVLLAVAHVDTLLFSLITLLSPQLSEGSWRKQISLGPLSHIKMRLCAVRELFLSPMLLLGILEDPGMELMQTCASLTWTYISTFWRRWALPSES